MHRYYQKYERWMQALIDRRHNGQQQYLLPASAVLLMAGIGGLFAFFLSLPFLFTQQYNFFGLFFIQVSFSVFYLLSFLRGWASLEFLISTFILANALFTGSVAYADGGLDSPFLPWLSLAPLISFLLNGFRGFRLWGAVSLVLLILFLFQPSLVLPTPPLPPHTKNVLSYTTLYLAQMLTVGLLVWVRKRSESTQRELDAQLEAYREHDSARLAGEQAERNRILALLEMELEPRLQAAEAAQNDWKSKRTSADTPPDDHLDLQAIRKEAQRIVQNLRRLPEAAQDLQTAIQTLAHDLREGLDLHVDLHIPATPSLPMSPQHIHLYRIVQEACRNIARHAQARQVRIQLTHDGLRVLQLTVEDDGIGIVARQNPGQGLQNIRDRTATLGGRFTIQNRPGGGTRLHCDFSSFAPPNRPRR